MNEQLDQDVVNLTKAIRQVESSKNPTARGASGEFGYYQFMPGTWAETTRKYKGAPVPVEQATPELQNEMAYRQVKEWKDAGYNPGQIASMWNAGPGKPNAYKEGWRGTNDQGVQYDTPAYAEKVAKEYQALKTGTAGGVQQIPQLTGHGLQPTPVAHAAPVSQETPQPAPKGDFLDQLTNVVTSIFPGKQVGESIGTLLGYGVSKMQGTDENYDLSAPTPLQVAGDVAQGALTVGLPGVGRSTGLLANTVGGKAIPALAPAKTALGTLGRTTALGAGIGAAGGVAEGDDLAGIAQRTAVGGALGGVLGVPAAGLKGLANLKDPGHIIQNRVKELTKLEDSYSTVRKVTANARKNGIDPSKILAETDLLRNAVDDTGTIRTQNAIQELNDFIKPQEDVISKLLYREGKTIPLDDVEKALKSAVNSSGLQGGALVRALKNVDDDIAGYALKADKARNVPASLIHEAKVDKYANINYLNPESKRADKVIAKALKEMVEELLETGDAKALNKELQTHYSVLNLLEKLDGKKVQGGKLGKYFAQTVGSIVGSHFGPLGSIVGAEAGGKIIGKQMSSTFGGKTGGVLKRSEAMDAALDLTKMPAIKKLKVNDLPTDFTDEIPVIEAGSGKVRRPKVDLPTIRY